MKELSIYYQYYDDQELYSIALNNYIEQNDIQDLEIEMILNILDHQNIEYDRNTVKVFNKELENWEDLEHFYVQVEDLFEDEGCYSYENGIRLLLQHIQQYEEIPLQSAQAQQVYQQDNQFQAEVPIDQQQQQQLVGQIVLELSNTIQMVNYLYEFSQQQLYNFDFSLNQFAGEINNNIMILQKEFQTLYDQVKNTKPKPAKTSTPKPQNENNNNQKNNNNPNPFIFNITPPEDEKQINFFEDFLPAENQNSNNNDSVLEEQEEANDGANMFAGLLTVNGKSDSPTERLQINTPKITNESLIKLTPSVNDSRGGGGLLSDMSKKLQMKSMISNNPTPSTPIIKHHSNLPMVAPVPTKNQTIRMSIMYSEPLVVRKDNLVYTAGEPVEYEQEILQLTRYFQTCKNNGEINIRVANLDNLEQEIMNSQILHISCHGDFHKQFQKYYLLFEEKNCELKCVTTEQFKILLQNKKDKPKLTFVNACHSEEVGQIFLNSGIPFVVAVQSNLKIQDKAAQIFSNSFYMGLMQGYSIRSAFKNAKDALIAKHHQACYTCCCAHKHASTCQWEQYAMEFGFQEAHKLHEDYACDCYNPSKQDGVINNPIFHKKSCQKIMNFFGQIDDQNKLDEIFMLDNNKPFNGCCCQDECTPHDESAKFKLLCLNDNLDFTFSFDKGDMLIKYNFDMYNSHFKSQFKLFGRNVEMYNIFNSLNDSSHNSQFVVVYGERGSGLTSISKKVARHLKEREVFNEIIIEDFESVDRGISKFKTKLKKFKNGKEGSSRYYILMILDNCDDLINKNMEDFTKQLSDTSLNVKFIIITHFKPNLKMNESVINYVELKPLDIKVAYEIISHHIGSQVRMFEQDPEAKGQLDKILESKPILPKLVMEIVQTIKNGSKLSDLLASQDPLDIIMKKLKENQPKYNMLLVVSLFPHGVSVEDLKYLASKNKICSNWEDLMLELTSNESIDPTLTSTLLMESDSAESSDNLEPNSKSNHNHGSLMTSGHSTERHFKIGQYFWMSVTRNELHIIQFKIKKNIPRWLYSKEDYAIDMLQKEVLILEYLSYFAKKMLNCIKSDRYQRLKMVDYSSIVDYGLFKVNFSQKWFEEEERNSEKSPSSPTPTLNRCYSDNFEEHIFQKYRKNLESLFKLHEQNLYVYLKKDDMMNLIKFMNSSHCSEKNILKEVLTDLCVDIPSIHKLLDHKDDALELCDKALSILDELIKNPNNMPFQFAKVKILFIQFNIFFDQFDFQTKNSEDSANLLKAFKILNDGIQSLERGEHSNQKNIITIMKAEKVFLIALTVKILIEQKYQKYIDNIEDRCDVSQLTDLVNLIDPKKKGNYTNSLKQVCQDLIDQLNLFPSDLQRIENNSIINNQNGNHLYSSANYLQEESQTNVLISKIKYVITCLEGFYYLEEINEEYIDQLSESIKVFSQYSLNELKDQCLRQFAKQFMKNKLIISRQSGQPSNSSSSQLETEIIRIMKSEQLDNLNIKETFEKAYAQMQTSETKDYKITIQTNA